MQHRDSPYNQILTFPDTARQGSNYVQSRPAVMPQCTLSPV